jgi:hypothetical protein
MASGVDDVGLVPQDGRVTGPALTLGEVEPDYQIPAPRLIARNLDTEFGLIVGTTGSGEAAGQERLLDQTGAVGGL